MTAWYERCVRSSTNLLLIVIVAVASVPIARAAPRIVEGKSFVVTLPDDYDDISAELHKRGLAAETIALAARTKTKGYQPTITIQLARVPTHTVDAATCTTTGRSLADGAKGKLVSAAMIAGPAGKACQIELVSQSGVALITELDAAKETWLMTCNHADGDSVADKTCRATLATFELKLKPTPR